ncbi:hypothetical protein F5Y03DRAFT_378286 [Xylaria venustula]|nr:hypothetical protein F5Y03DRAFT_378286 [Xylaria venustula]
MMSPQVEDSEKSCHYNNIGIKNGVEDVSLDDGLPTQNHPRSAKWSSESSRAILSAFKDIVFFILSIVAIFTVGQGVLRSQPRAEQVASVKSTINDAPCICGNSTAEAKAMGCRFDLAATSWAPEHCIDRELLEEFERRGEGPDGRWQWYADPQYTMEVTRKEIEELGDHRGTVIYTTLGWHKAHCFYYWQKLQRAPTTGVRLGGRYNNEGHTNHCGRVLQEPSSRSFSYIGFEVEDTNPPDFIKHLLPINWPMNIDGPEKWLELYEHHH